MRSGQRDFSPYYHLARNALPEMRVEEIDETTFDLRVVGQRTGTCAVVFRRAQIVRTLRDRQAAFALKYSTAVNRALGYRL